MITASTGRLPFRALLLGDRQLHDVRRSVLKRDDRLFPSGGLMEYRRGGREQGNPSSAGASGAIVATGEAHPSQLLRRIGMSSVKSGTRAAQPSDLGVSGSSRRPTLIVKHATLQGGAAGSEGTASCALCRRDQTVLDRAIDAGPRHRMCSAGLLQDDLGARPVDIANQALRRYHSRAPTAYSATLPPACRNAAAGAADAGQ